MIQIQMLRNIVFKLNLNRRNNSTRVRKIGAEKSRNACLHGAWILVTTCLLNAPFAQAQSNKIKLVSLQTHSKPSEGRASYVYRAKAGDTPESIAFEFLTQASQKNVRERFYSHNHVTINAVNKPTVMNQPFNLPVAWMYLKPVFATVVSVTGNAQISRANSPLEFIRLNATEQALDEGSTIQTGENSFVIVRLPDNSILSITQRSDVTLEVLKRYASSDIFKIKVMLNKGRVESEVMPLTNQASDYSVRSRRLTTGVRGTKFNVSDSLESNATTEVLEGAVKLTDKSDKSQSVPKGFGSFVAQEKAADVVALLPAPMWQCKSDELIKTGTLPLVFNQTPNSYRVDVFSANTGKQLVALTTLGLPVNLPDGVYRFDVRGGDINGIQGYSSEQLISVSEVTQPGIKQWIFNDVTKTWVIQESAELTRKQYKCNAS
jgi:hypothetical protein